MPNDIHQFKVEDDLLVTAEVASFLKVHVESVRRLIREKRLAAIKIGRHWRVTRAEISRAMGAGGI